MAMLNIPRHNTDPAYRYKMPALTSKVEGRGNGIKTNLTNMVQVAKALNVNPAYTTKFFGVELGAQTKFENKESEGVRAIVMGNHKTEELQRLLDKYIDYFVLCPNCSLPEIDTMVKKGVISAKCKACGWNGTLQAATDHRVCQLIVKEEERESGNKKKGDKKSRQAARALKQRQQQDDDDDEEDNDETVREKKKKKKKHKHGDDEDGEKKKKKKKKKSKDDKEKDSDDESEMSKTESGSGKSDKENKKTKKENDDELTIDSCEIVDVIERMSDVSDADFFEELRVLQLSCDFDMKLRFYCALQALFPSKGGCPLTGALITEKAAVMKEVSKSMSGEDKIWAFESYYHAHAKVDEETGKRLLKQMPMVFKSLYDEDLIAEEEFIAYYAITERDNIGFSPIKTAVAPFIEWLKTEEDSEANSDEGSSD